MAEEKEYLDQLRQSRTAAVRDVQRAQILWRCQAGETVSQIARVLQMTRKSVLQRRENPAGPHHQDR